MCDASKDICSLFNVRITVAKKCDSVAKIGQDWSGLMTSCLESSHEIDFGTKVSFKLGVLTFVPNTRFETDFCPLLHHSLITQQTLKQYWNPFLIAYLLFVCLLGCWVIYFQVASILAAYLRYTRLSVPNHLSPATLAYLHFTREIRRVFQGIIVP